MQNVEQYIDRIMEIADLTRKDEKRVRSELASHIQELLNAGEKSGLEESEVMSMIENEFGKPEELGKMIARSRGKFRTYLKKEARKFLITLAVFIVIALAIRAVAFEAFRVTSDVASPVVPEGCRVLVNKLTNNFETNDVVIYRPDKHARVGIIKEIDTDKDGVVVARKNEEDVFVSKEKIVGKAFILYSCSLL
jgi:hypothetical protein